jgi:cyclic 2,3-diphosphoglycerate synthetase
VASAAKALGRRAVLFDLRLRPAEPLGGRRAAVFTAGPAPVEHLEEVVSHSRNLADRELLRRDLESVDAEVYVVELKAAAIDLVAETAASRGIPVVLAGNDVVSPGLDETLLELTDLAAGAQARENLLR